MDFTLSTKQAPVPIYAPVLVHKATYEPIERVQSERDESRKLARRQTYQPDGRERLSLPGYKGAYISGLTGKENMFVSRNVNGL